MKSVLLSIKPKRCERIANGEQTVEIRKNRPKIDTPFKCYIYCTNGKDKLLDVVHKGDTLYGVKIEKTEFIKTPDCDIELWKWRGKVIGEFVCDDISMSFAGYKNNIPGYWDILNGSCLSNDELMEYGHWQILYGWHISDLVIYDEPRELSEFIKYNRTSDDCYYSDLGLAIPKSCKQCKACGLKRPPQSWCYVEELEE